MSGPSVVYPAEAPDKPPNRKNGPAAVLNVHVQLTAQAV